MFKKICNRCYRPSFRSASNGKWICPVCEEDLTDQAKLPIHPIRPKPRLEIVYGPIYKSHNNKV